MTPEIARECLTLGGRKTTDLEVARFVADVERGIPVMPVTFFCDFLKQWAQLYGQPVESERYVGQREERQKLRDQADYVFFQIIKSNLLYRTIYCGEPVRTKPCPDHKGHWSGCNLPEDTSCKGACMYAGNITGWLPNEEPQA